MHTTVEESASFFCLYLKRTLAVVVLHVFVGSTNKQHSGTVILRRDGEERTTHEQHGLRQCVRTAGILQVILLCWRKKADELRRQNSPKAKEVRGAGSDQCNGPSTDTGKRSTEHLLPASGTQLHPLLSVYLLLHSQRERERGREG